MQIRKIISSLFWLLFAYSFGQPAHNKIVVGYYAQWAIYARDYNVAKIDASKLTHLHYAFFGTYYDPSHPESTALQSLDTYADFEHNEGGHSVDDAYKGNFADMRDLKKKYPHLKILISVGGWTKSQNFPAIAANAVARTALANSMKQLMEKYSFIDGFDIDWEFPVTGGTDGNETVNGSNVPIQPHNADDAKNLVVLVKTMRNVMPGALISVAAGNNVDNIPTQFIGPNNKASFGIGDNLMDYIDYLTFFGYDLGGNWNDKTCYNAPLYGSRNSNDPLYNSNPSKDWSVANLVNIYKSTLGIPANKLVMGMPFYGKIFENVGASGGSSTMAGLYRSAPRSTGTCTLPQAPKGTWDAITCENTGSIEFCDLAGTIATNAHHYLDPNNRLRVSTSAASAGWVRYWDDACKVPYLYNSTTKQFISYDDEQSVQQKVAYLLSQGLGGAMIWELSQDTRDKDVAPKNYLLTMLDAALDAAITTVSISGRTKLVDGTVIPGAVVNLVNSSGAVLSSVTSDATGNYNFPTVISGSSYSLKATKAGYAFSDASVNAATTNLSGQDLTGATVAVVNVSGKTTTSDGTAISSATVTLVDALGIIVSTKTSDASGYFSFDNVTSGASYTLKASKSGYTFTDVSLGVVNTDVSNKNIIGAVPSSLIYGYVKNGSTPVSGAIVQLTMNYKDASHPWKSVTATTDATGKYMFNNSDVAGYGQFATLQLNTWDNNNVSYYPASYTNQAIGSTSVVYNFNAQKDPVPTYTISGKTVTDGGAAIAQATVSLVNASGTVVDTKISDASGNFNFADITSGISYTLKGTKAAYVFTNVLIGTLSADVTNKNLVGIAVPLVTISGKTTTADGNILANVTVSLVDDAGNILSTTSDNSGNFSFTNVTSGISYNLKGAKAGYDFSNLSLGIVQNDLVNKNLIGAAKQYHKTPLPSKVILGYAHSWENSSAPFLFFKEIADQTKFNVVAYSFIETVNSDGYTPTLTINSPRYQSKGVFDEQLLKDDIAYLKNKGIPVIVSIGGQNGHVSLDTEQKKNTFVQGIEAIIDKYDFDGVDLDFEGTSMNFGAGSLKNFSYASISAYPKLKNIVDAFKEIKQNYGSSFILTCAPETYYVQVGYSIYNSAAGTFLPVMDNLRNELDLIMVQLYNTGSVNALNGVAYSQGTANFLTSMTDMLFTGFKVGASYFFNGFPASKLLVGIPACSSAAPSGGYISPKEAIKAFDYMRYGITYPGNYTLRGGDIDLRGVMTWSINWDVSSFCGVANEFGDSYYQYFYPETTGVEHLDDSEVLIYPNPVKETLHLDANKNEISEVSIMDLSGKIIISIHNPGKTIDVTSLHSGIYLVSSKLKEGRTIFKKIIKN